LPEAERQLAALDRAVARRIAKRLRWLAQYASRFAHRPLRSQLAGLNKLRVGDWRVLYRVLDEEQIVLIFRIGHRRDVYDL
jgi:mRNA interferase RelE/StbE